MAYELPENLTALSADELQALVDSGLDALRALGVTPESDEDTVAEGERIVELIKQVSSQQEAETARSVRAGRAQSLLQVLETPTEPEPQPQEPETPDQPETPEGETVQPDEVIPAEPVSASGRTSPARRAAANATPAPIPRSTSMVASLTAAADVPGIPTGQPLDGLTAACNALIARMKGLPSGRMGGPSGVRHRYGAAMIRKDYGDMIQRDGISDYDLIWEVSSEKRLPGGALTAAATGWCSPSETLYDLCQFEQVQGILSLPEIGIPRGGIRWTEGPDFGDIYTECGFQFPESAVIDETATKTCCIVDCPPFDEIRADLIGLCVKAPLLTQATYPELVRRYMEGALVAHQHKINTYLLNIMAAAAGTPSVGDDAGSLSANLIALQYAAIGMRYRYRMGENTTIEAVAPWWLKELIKADWGMRQLPPEVSDAAVNKWFSDRQMSVQWVFDFQNPTVNGCLVTIPANATVLLYPAGTWVKGTIDVINVDAIYDSTNLEQNIYTALFMEEGILAVQRCTHTCAVTIAACVSGRTAANDITECMAPPGATAPTALEEVPAEEVPAKQTATTSK